MEGTTLGGPPLASNSAPKGKSIQLSIHSLFAIASIPVQAKKKRKNKKKKKVNKAVELYKKTATASSDEYTSSDGEDYSDDQVISTHARLVIFKMHSRTKALKVTRKEDIIQ